MYQAEQPSREEIDSLKGLVVLEFGTNWCPICQAAQADIASALSGHPQIRHLKIEDGKGRPLGRSFGVKLWPNLVLLQDGQLRDQLSRPNSEELTAAVGRLLP